MKIILAIFCALMVLFAGGCAVLLVISTGGLGAPFALVPGGIAVLNVFMLMGMYGSKQPKRWAFYTLAVVDVLAALVLLLTSATLAAQMADIFVLTGPLSGLLLLKAWLSVRAARDIPPTAGG